VDYGPEDTDNAVVANWANGENPYAVGINVYVDDVLLGALEGDDETVGIGTFAPPGPHKVGVQGDCGPPAGVSTTTEATIQILDASPHPSPISGAGIACQFTPDPDGDGLETSTTVATWMPDDPSNFIDVFVVSGTDIFFLGSIAGSESTVTITNTAPEDRVALQFFATIDGNCYGSPILECGPVVPPGNRYMQGLCNGTGTSPQITSAVFFLNYLFVGGGQVPPCLKACDANGDGQGNLTDAVYVLSYLFSGGPPPTLWVDSDGDTIVDPTCTLAAPEDDCAAGHEACAG
jgi:hypothetical protein